MTRLLLALLLWGRAASASSDIMVVVSDDPGLAAAVVTATSQQYAGPVALAPARWNGAVQPGASKLLVSQLEDQKWRVVLTGPDASVSRELVLAPSSRRLDVAEAVALAVPGLASRLEVKSKAVREREAQAEKEAEKDSQPAPVPSPKPGGDPASAAPPVGEAALATVTPDAPAAVVPPEPRRWTIGVEPALFFSGETNIPAGGAELFSTIALVRDWQVELALGGYRTYAWQYNIGMFPIDALIGVGGDWRRLYWEIGVGPELLVAESSIGSGATLGAVTTIGAGVHITKNWLVGIRASLAYTPGNPDIGPTGKGQDQDQIFLDDTNFRLGLAISWEQ